MEEKDSLSKEQPARINGGARLDQECMIDDKTKRGTLDDTNSQEIEGDGKDVPGGNEGWLKR